MRSIYRLLALTATGQSAQSRQANPLRVFTSVDLENVAGVVDPAQLGPDGFECERARHLKTGEANPAIADKFLRLQRRRGLSRNLWRPGSLKLKVRCPPSLAVFTLIALVGTKPALANQETHGQPDKDTPVELIVDRVEAESPAAKAGLHSGDVLRSWSALGVDQTTTFKSPFDLQPLEIETGQEKQVTIEGLRANRYHVWSVGPGKWGVEAHPRLSAEQLSLHRELERLVRQNTLGDAIGRFASAESHGSKSVQSWVRYWLLRDLGESLARRKDWKASDEVYQAATGVAQIPSAVAAELFWSWAATYKERGDTSRVEFCYQKALAETQKAGDQLLTAFNLNMLGDFAYRRGELERAEQDYDQALNIEQHSPAVSLNLANSLTGLGNVAQARDDLTKAEKCHLQAMEVRQRLAPGGIDVASSLNNLGNVAESRGDLKKAEDYHRRALAIRTRLVPGSVYHATSLLNLGVIAFDQADFGSARSFFLQALPIAQKHAPGGPGVAAIFNNLAVIAIERGELSAAALYNREALQIEEKLAPGGLDVAQSLANLGDVAQRQGNLAKAERYQRRALTIQSRVAPDGLGVAATSENLASLARDQGDFPTAEKYYRNALEIREKLAPDSQLHANNVAALATVLHAEKRWDESAAFFEQALNAFENEAAHLGGSDEAHLRFRAQHAKYYREYVDLLLDQHKPELALDVLERSRARTLLEMLSEAKIDVRSGVDPSLVQREQVVQNLIEQASDRRLRLLSGEHTKRQIAEVNGEIDELITEFQKLQAEIRFKNPSYAALTQPQTIKLEQIQRDLLDKDTLLLEYMLGDKRSYLWVVGQDSLTTFQLPSRRTIEDLTRHLFVSWTARSHADESESSTRRRIRLTGTDAEASRTAAALGHMILGPAESSLNRKRLLIVGDGALLYVPFAALPVPGRERAVPLVENYEIVNLPSASVLSVLQEEEQHRARAANSVVVLADPVFAKSDPRVQLAKNELSSSIHAKTSSSFSQPVRSGRRLRSMNGFRPEISGTLHLQRLPFTRQEAELILAATPPGRGRKALDFAASRALATSPDLAHYKIVHFATHGIIESRNPQLSGLVFSLVDKEGRPQNGFLELQDIYNLRLPVDLVVLSACETGLGNEIDGEGLVGLTRGFMYAGASRVAASLWKVSDAATATLMGYFYQAMEEKAMTPAAALRFAQLQVMKKKRWSAPYYWAPFQIQGEWK